MYISVNLWIKMAFYSCNRYRTIVLILLILIMWQFFRLLPQKPSSDLTEVSWFILPTISNRYANPWLRNGFRASKLKELTTDKTRFHLLWLNMFYFFRLISWNWKTISTTSINKTKSESECTMRLFVLTRSISS